VTVDPSDLAGRLRTGRYQTWRPADGVPIRSSVGKARFWRHHFEPIHVTEITPYGVFGRQLDDDDARALYLSRLDRLGGRAIAKLAGIARAHPASNGLVVLCFEPAGEPCHRVWLREWFADRHGIDVPEVVHRTSVKRRLRAEPPLRPSTPPVSCRRSTC
jgi:hypothetical protein